MRWNFFHIILFCSIFICCDNDDYPYSKIPSVVLNEFHAQFPNAKNVEIKKKEQHYEIEFEVTKKDYEVLISTKGIILKYKKELSWTELPAEVRSSLKKEYGEAEIKNLEIINTAEQKYFQVQVNRFLSEKKVVINKKGKPDASIDYWN